MSITHNLENLTDKQKSDLELAKILVNNLNSLKPLHVNNINITYNGNTFHPMDGYLSKFLVDDIYLAIKGDFEKHKKFMIKTIRKFFKEYDSSKKDDASLQLLKEQTTALLKYYGFESDIIYPIYSDEVSFKKYLIDLNKSVEKGLLES